jgi:GNAT superfamily N-acetyltransferase
MLKARNGRDRLAIPNPRSAIIAYAMTSEPIIRLSTADDRDAILAFIAKSGFNPRDAITWDGLKMMAMTAWQDDRLIGAIPFEPRQLRIAADLTVPTIHETTVAIGPDHRGGGLGSRMQSAIFEQRPSNSELVTVFREDPASPAYRWYLKNGFSAVMKIHSWFCDRPIADGLLPRFWMFSDPLAPWSAFGHQNPVGRVDRDLKSWLAMHPYRKRYRFWIIADESGAAALLGVGTMHSQTERADVLEWTAPDGSSAEQLLQAICNVAVMKDWRPVRVPLAENDPRTELLKARCWESRWSFDMLARSLSANFTEAKPVDWRYAGIDYI